MEVAQLLKAESLLIDTGNLINCNELKRKASQSAKDELLESLTCTANVCMQNKENVLQNDCLVMRNPQQTLIENEERKELKLTVKVFLERYDCNLLRESIEKVMSNLKVDVLDSLILTLPPSPVVPVVPGAVEAASPTKSPNSPSSVLNDLDPLWRLLENLVVEEKKLLAIGVSDLDTQQLEELYNWAQIKPSVNQVNLESCCVMPKEMTVFAKDHDIQLLTHSDPKVILTTESLSEVLHPILDNGSTPINWQPEWIARYSAIVKHRGIIQNRGYVLSARKKH